MVESGRLVRKAFATAVAFFALCSPAYASGQSGMVAAVNQARLQHGLQPVQVAPQLHRIAIQHSDSMVSLRYFAHTSPSGQTVYDRIVGSGFVTGYTWQGAETLAYGYASPQSTVRAWLASPEHRAVLLSPSFRWIGVGRAWRHGIPYWTADWVMRS